MAQRNDSDSQKKTTQTKKSKVSVTKMSTATKRPVAENKSKTVTKKTTASANKKSVVKKTSTTTQKSATSQNATAKKSATRNTSKATNITSKQTPTSRSKKTSAKSTNKTGTDIAKKNTTAKPKQNIETVTPQEQQNQVKVVQGYYKLHAAIYDITRWTFLFGREKILKMIPLARDAKLEILEIGCGTAKNILALSKTFVNANFTAYEVSDDMLNVARKKTEKLGERMTFINEPYSSKAKPGKKFDVVLFSYSLTMINPQYAELIEQAKRDLRPGGIIVVVDFHDTPSILYRNYMIFNHVKMEAHLLPVLEKNFSTLQKEIHKGYLGVWQYFLYLGKK